MQTKEYLQLVESELKDYFSEDDLELIQVWYCKTIQNHKGLFIVRNSYGLIYDFGKWLIGIILAVPHDAQIIPAINFTDSKHNSSRLIYLVGNHA